VIGVHTYRRSKRPPGDKDVVSQLGTSQASALSEVIYRRLLQNDIQYHQAIIARTLFTFVTAAKRHIAA
jgi:hypothetical protein